MIEPDVAGLGARAQAALGRRLGALRPLPGGISSLTFAATAEADGVGDHERAVVIKVAPPGLAPVRNRDVLRQARVLRALHAVRGVRVPQVLGEDPGDPPLFVMSFVAGESFEPCWDVATAAVALAPPIIRERALAAAQMLACLQSADPARLDVGVAAEPALSPREELERWATLYATVGEELRAGEAGLRRALEASAPAPLAARVLHGDYRLGNLLFSGAELTAIIDWEIWSVGDPRCDIAWLMHFCDPVMERRDVDAALAAAMPEPAEVLAAYRAAAAPGLRERVAEQLDWFRALAAYKLGATMAALAKRNRRRPDPDPSLERAAQTTPPLLARALERLVGR